MIGSILLNRYKIESELGKGGMGIVYKAHDTLLNRAVAIKFLNTAGVGTEGKARLLQEARAAAQLNHPNIVSVYDAGATDGNPFIVMELVRGHTLRKAEKPTLLEALNMAQQICLALDHAHSNGIIHRDLKLENIVVTNTQTLKLMDFGLARTADDAHLTQEGALMGTLAYLAPELIQGQPASAQSDLYAFGIILYELLVGQEPFQGNIGAVLGQHLHGQVKPPSKFSDEIPDWVDELVLGLLSKRPEERPASAREVLAILENKITPPITAAYIIPPKPRNNLPTQITSFIGREKEIKEVVDAINTHRLVTLTGSGGTGKTRLSIEVGTNLTGQFPDGVWFIELAPLVDSDLIPQTILSAMGVSEQAGKSPLEVLKEFLPTKKSLIVLDNCEHLVEASAKVTDVLLNAAPEIKILASSREALGIKGELSYPVPSLSLPDPKNLPALEQLSQYEAVRLFIDRALLTTPHFVLDKDNASSVAQICSRLDGIPLAIELSAARVKMLSVEQIAKRLDDRFRLLTGGARTALPRQQTLRALIDWSYNLLGEQEKTLFRRLAVFVDGWTLEAAEAVCGGEGIETDQILDLMSQLVNKSLINVETTKVETRYHRLETIRQYAREKLFDTEEASPVRDRHLDYFVGLAEQAETEMLNSNQAVWLKRLMDDFENIRAALEWSQEERIEAGLRLGGALWRFGLRQGRINELAERLTQLLEHPASTRSSARAKALASTSELLFWANDIPRARSFAEEGLAISRELMDRPSEAISLHALGNVEFAPADTATFYLQSLALYRELNDNLGISYLLIVMGFTLKVNDPEQARVYLEEALALCRARGDAIGMAGALNNLGELASDIQGDFSLARMRFEESLAIQRALGEAGYSSTLHGLGKLAMWQGDYAAADVYCEEALVMDQREGLMLTAQWAHALLGHIKVRAGNTEQARSILTEALDRFARIHNMDGVNYCLEGLASLAVLQNKFDQAVRLIAWADHSRTEPHNPRSPLEQQIIDRDLATIRTHLDEAAVAAAYSAGHAMTINESIKLASEV